MIAIEPMAQDPVVSFACIKTLVTVKFIEYVVSSVLFLANLFMLATKSVVITLIPYINSFKSNEGNHSAFFKLAKNIYISCF